MIREFHEQTGVATGHIGTAVSLRQVTLQLPDGEWVVADERYFALATGALDISCARMERARKGGHGRASLVVVDICKLEFVDVVEPATQKQATSNLPHRVSAFDDLGDAVSFNY